MKTTGLICLALISTAAAPTTTSQWKCVKNDDGISAYVSSTATSSVQATKTEMTVNANTKKVVAVIMDMNNYKKWLPYCKESYIIQQVSDTVCYGYQRISAPVVADRDVAIRCTATKIGKDEYEISITAVPNFVKKNSNAVRIQHLLTHYTIKGDAKGRTFVSQTNEVDIGGSVPGFLINWSNKSQPYETFQRLRKTISEQI